MVRVAINGFGRIGRMVLRLGFHDENIEFVGINDLTDTKTLAHLLKNDTGQGAFNADITFSDDSIIIDGNEIPITAIKDPTELPWDKLDVDVVVESTGFFRKRDDAAKHLKAGAKKVIISAPSGDSDQVIVKGVNEHDYESKTHHVVSNASCTTNCLAPVVKVLDDNFGIKKGFMTTVHAYTADQRLQDAPHKDLRRARAAAQNVIPTSTGAAIAVTQVIPHLKGKLDGIALRVPVITGSVTDFVCEVNKEVTIEQINTLFNSVASNELKGVMEFSMEPLVSSDIIGNHHSCIVDGQLTNVTGGNLVKVVAWYDNEAGYSSRMVDLIKQVGCCNCEK